MSRLEYEKLGIGINVKNKGLKGDGVTNDATALNALITAIGSTPTDFYFGSSTYKISGNITFPSTIRLRFEMGAMLSIDTGVVVTINGGIDAGLGQIFSGLGSVTGNPIVKYVYPQWWGAVGDGVTNDYTPFRASVVFGGATSTDVYLPEGVYYMGNSTTLPANVSLVFHSRAILKIASGITITGTNTKIVAGLTQVFDMTLGGFPNGTWDINRLYLQWFGGSISADNTTAFSKCFTFMRQTNVKTLYITQGNYLITPGTLRFPPSIKIIGVGNPKIYSQSSVAYDFYFKSDAGVYTSVEFDGITFDQLGDTFSYTYFVTSQPTTRLGFILCSRHTGNFVVKNCKFLCSGMNPIQSDNFEKSGMYIVDNNEFTFSRPKIFLADGTTVKEFWDTSLIFATCTYAIITNNKCYATDNSHTGVFWQYESAIDIQTTEGAYIYNNYAMNGNNFALLGSAFYTPDTTKEPCYDVCHNRTYNMSVGVTIYPTYGVGTVAYATNNMKIHHNTFDLVIKKMTLGASTRTPGVAVKVYSDQSSSTKSEVLKNLVIYDNIFKSHDSSESMSGMAHLGSWGGAINLNGGWLVQDVDIYNNEFINFPHQVLVPLRLAWDLGDVRNNNVKFKSNKVVNCEYNTNGVVGANASSVFFIHGCDNLEISDNEIIFDDANLKTSLIFNFYKYYENLTMLNNKFISRISGFDTREFIINDFTHFQNAIINHDIGVLRTWNNPDEYMKTYYTQTDAITAGKQYYKYDRLIYTGTGTKLGWRFNQDYSSKTFVTKNATYVSSYTMDLDNTTDLSVGDVIFIDGTNARTICKINGNILTVTESISSWSETKPITPKTNVAHYSIIGV